MVAILQNSAGFSIDRVINLALLKINGAPLSRQTDTGSVEVTYKDTFMLCNRSLLDVYDWFFLVRIRWARGYSNTDVTVGGEFNKHGYGEVPYQPYQNYPDNFFPIAAEELIEQFPYYYINVLITSIAKELATSYAGNLQKRQLLQNIYIQDLGAAKIADQKYRYKSMGICNGYSFI